VEEPTLDEMILGVFKGIPLMVLMNKFKYGLSGNGWSIRKANHTIGGK
jgi:hypothetical protein